MNEKSLEYFKNRLSKTLSDKRREAYRDAVEALEKARNERWIPVSKRLPEPDKIVVVTMHCSEWISDYDSDWVPEDEKIHHEEEYVVNVGYMGEDGYWIVFNGEGCEVCCDKKFGTDQGCAYSVITAWKSLPEPYKGE